MISFWLALTNIAGTDIGSKIEDHLWSVVGIVGGVVILLLIFGFLSSPTTLTTDEQIKNSGSSYDDRKNCANCGYYDYANEKCTMTGSSVSSPHNMKCSYFKKR